jgi:hypothetical protein
MVFGAIKQGRIGLAALALTVGSTASMAGPSGVADAAQCYERYVGGRVNDRTYAVG